MSSPEIAGHSLRDLLAEPGHWSTVYTDGPQGEPPGAVESRMRSLKDSMLDAGIPEDDAEAAIAALPDDTGTPAPSARWLLISDGRIVADTGWATARRGQERLSFGAFPDVLPLLRHRSDETRILVVETARDGADLSLQRLGRATPEQEQHVSGEDHPITKVSPGGWSQARFQRSVEEVWQRNQDEIAAEVDRIVRAHRPSHVFVTGDAHVRGLLLESISPEALDLVVEVDVITSAAGADDTALVEAIDETIAESHDSQVSILRDQAAERDGVNGAAGLSAVVEALQQAQVDTLLLDERMSDSSTLLALPAEPWIAVSSADSFDAGAGVPLPAIQALVRAAVLTDAELVFLAEELPEGEPFDDSTAAQPLAVLRWPASPVASDSDQGSGAGGGDHPSQAEGEDPDDPPTRPDPQTAGHPSQAEGA
ncbi:Vms1/Ankzf1 family peptidyl-tRNA hydrolase [Microbacterium sp. Mu-80]|uniref:Vms1/Ankzf1 family peptidyl-tRNA hydrolase n=1 Tax=Microbacterium bandirmense TaxID=3122050 RepID=A0ABU8LDD2_9MICO